MVFLICVTYSMYHKNTASIARAKVL